MIELFGSALVTFLVIIDPPGCAPIFASLTRGGTPAHRRAMAVRSSLIAWAILMFFAVLGKPLLQALGISLASFRIAGGIMLFFIAIDRRCAPVASRVRLAKIGAQPGGSMITRKVTSAEPNNSIIWRESAC